jgi:hypothetical protein
MAVLTIGRNLQHKTRVLILASAVVAAVVVFGSTPAKAQDQSGLAAPIEGTWIFNIHRVTQGFSFSALQSFTAGGVTLATGTVDRTPPPAISPLYGSWSRQPDNSYAVTICFFAFNDAGTALVMIKTNEIFRLTDKNSLVGAGEAVVCDVNGDNCMDAGLPITITGKRLIAQGA